MVSSRCELLMNKTKKNYSIFDHNLDLSVEHVVDIAGKCQSIKIVNTAPHDCIVQQTYQYSRRARVRSSAETWLSLGNNAKHANKQKFSKKKRFTPFEISLRIFVKLKLYCMYTIRNDSIGSNIFFFPTVKTLYLFFLRIVIILRNNELLLIQQSIFRIYCISVNEWICSNKKWIDSSSHTIFDEFYSWATMRRIF